MLRYALRNLLARKLRLAMSTLAIVLGIAFLSGVMVFSHALNTTFNGIVDGSTADAVVRATGTRSFSAAPTGSDVLLTPHDVDRLRALPQVARAAPGVGGLGVYLLDSSGHLVGGRGAPTVAFSHGGGLNMRGEPIMDLRSGHWPQAPGEVVLDTGAAKRAGYHLGDPVSLIVPSGNPMRRMTLVGTGDFNGGGTAGAILVVLDTTTAQELFLGGRDGYTTVDLTAAPGVSQAELARAARTVLPAGFSAVTGDRVAAESKNAFSGLLNVISTFLLVFALIAVVVGAFIIVNTFSILVVQRTRELALVRALGASRRQVTTSVLAEATAMAVIASSAGIVLGWLLARGLAGLFRSFGLDIADRSLRLSAGSIATGYAVGILVTLVAAYVPARRAARVAPMAAMGGVSGAVASSLHRRVLLGGIVLALGAALATFGILGAPGNDAAWVGAGALVWLATFAVLAPVLGRPVLVACRGVFTRLFGATGQLAAENALRDPRRTGATASALMVGLALVATIGVLAASLEASVQQSVDRQFRADFLVQGVGGSSFPTSIADQLTRVPGVKVVARQQLLTPQLDGGSVYVAGIDTGFDAVYHLTLVSGRQQLAAGEALVTRATASKHHWRLGSTFTLGFPAGRSLRLKVAGVMSDSTDVTAPITLRLADLAATGVSRQDSLLSIDVSPGADKAAVHAALDKVVAPLPIVSVQDKDQFTASVRSQVNQLLYLIYGLLALAVVIAIVGIVNTLGLSVVERTRELGLLRAIGMNRTRVRLLVTLESIAITLVGAVLGLTLGLGSGVALRQALSHDLTALGVPVVQLLVFLGVAVVVGVLAAVAPAVRAARLDVLRAIATE